MGNDEINKIKICSVALYYILGSSSKKINKLIELYNNPCILFEDKNERKLCGLFSDKELNRFDNSLSLAKKSIETAENNNQKIITIFDDEYPNLLKQIYAPPIVLFYRGFWPDFDNEVSIAVVGTRKCSNYGAYVAENISKDLSKSGIIIISGGAKGVDSFAHSGVLKEYGRTVAVLGCSIDYPYLIENQKMRDMIEQRGAVVSEYPPGISPSKWTFPERNRIISGLSLGSLIVEAGEKSGSLITANYAIEQGRELFAVPGDITNPSYLGTNKLIKDGAKAVFSANDIIEEFYSLYPYKLKFDNFTKNILKTSSVNEIEGASQKTNNKKIKQNKIKTNNSINYSELNYLNDAEIKVLKIIEEKIKISIDDIINLNCIDYKKCVNILTKLEMNNLIEMVSGNLYSIK